MFCCLSCDSRQPGIQPDDLSGLWIIESNDIPIVSSLGYSMYTNQLDHMLLLNEDGSCAYRGFDEYSIPALWGNTEHVLHNGFLQEGSDLWPKGVPGTESWYLFGTAPFVFEGPFQSTNECSNPAGNFYKNKWVSWEVVNRRMFSPGMKEAETLLSAKCRVHVVLSNTGEPAGNFSGTLSFHLGSDGQGAFLWLPTCSQIDGYGEQAVKFRKANLGPRPAATGEQPPPR
jgi:hypothetical protein